VRASDFVVRLGGDEFVCLVVDEDAKAAAVVVAERIREVCNHPIRFADHETLLRPSIGVAIGQAGADWQTLLSQADAAMYLAKRSKCEGPMLFSQEAARTLRGKADDTDLAKEKETVAA
jgi:diguanylate cyclase (GGDEF)-like protein